ISRLQSSSDDLAVNFKTNQAREPGHVPFPEGLAGKVSPLNRANPLRRFNTVSDKEKKRGTKHSHQEATHHQKESEPESAYFTGQGVAGGDVSAGGRGIGVDHCSIWSDDEASHVL